mgnify:CR=1 FL=1
MKSITELCREKGILLDKELFDILTTLEDKTDLESFLEKVSGSLNQKIITKTLFMKNVEKLQFVSDDKKLLEHLFIQLGITIDIRREVPSLLRVEETSVASRALEGLKIISSTILPAKKLEVENLKLGKI